MTQITIKNGRNTYTPLKVYDAQEKYSRLDNLIGAVCMVAIVFFAVYGIILSLLSGFADTTTTLRDPETFLLGASPFAAAAWTLLWTLVCTALYYMPRKLFTVLGTAVVVIIAALMVWLNFDSVRQTFLYIFYTLSNRIIKAGYSLVITVDIDMLSSAAYAARKSMADSFAMMLSLPLTMIISYLVYSRRTVVNLLLVSLIFLFPGFYFGMIPTGITFILVLASWMAVLCMNIYNRRRMVKMIKRQNSIPVKRQSRTDAKKAKKLNKNEIAAHRKRLRFMVNDFKINDHSEEIALVRKRIKQLKERPMPVKDSDKKKSPTAATLSDASPLSPQALRISRNTYDGMVGITGFALTLFALILCLMFIPSNSMLRVPLPDEMLDNVSSVVEYAFSGSNASVYGGYNGGMGGGQLYSPNGISFKNKQIMQVTSRNCNTIYLKGWVGGYYTGSMWLESDKRQRDMLRGQFGNEFPLSSQTVGFYDMEQQLLNISDTRRLAEMVYDTVEIKHLVSGGKIAFAPYFTLNIDGAADYRASYNMDKGISLSRTLFRYPQYSLSTISSDFIMRRDMEVYDLFMEYIDNYTRDFPTGADANPVAVRGKYNTYKQSLVYTYLVKDSGIVVSTEEFGIVEPDILSYDISDGSYEYDIPSDDIIWNETLSKAVQALDDETRSKVEQEGLHVVISIKEIPDPDKALLLDNYINFAQNELKYRAYVRDNYLQLPEDFRQEIRDLAADLTKDSDNDFERALAIETYLRRNHSYTLVPDKPSDPTADFVYNFLFDTKEGYCTYYATSMVTMLRSIGIPARYVEGYIVDNSYKVGRDLAGNENPYTTVYDFNAHAWCEVYFPGGGWIPFEPTTPAPAPEGAEEEEYVYRPPANTNMPSGPLYPEYVQPLDGSDDFNFELPGINNYTRAAILIGAFLVFYFIIRTVNRVVNTARLSKFRDSNTNEAVVKMLNYTLKLLGLCGYNIETDEGLAHYAARVLDKSEFMINTEFDRIVQIMQKARFSDHQVTESERDEVYQFVRMMRHNLYRYSNVFDRLRFKYVLVIL